jgi:hypothetical protein
MLLLGTLAIGSYAQPTVEIRINLEGYPSNMPKKAMVLSKSVLNNPILVLKNNVGATLKEFKCTLHEKFWEPFSHYYVKFFRV